MPVLTFPRGPDSWKPSADEKKAIRVYATGRAHHPGQIVLRPAKRASIDDGFACFNLLRVGGGWDTDCLRGSDLYDRSDWGTFCRNGVPLTRGRAIVDIYVSLRGTDELLHNVQAWVDTVDGDPRLVRLTGTLMKEQEVCL